MHPAVLRSALVALALLVLAAPLVAQQQEVAHSDDFQSYGSPKNPPGWVDTSVGGAAANGLYKTWPDPLEGNKGSNLVFGTKQSSGRPEGNHPRIGTFSTLTTKSFFGKGRFEYRGRFIRTSADTRIGLTFFSSYPERDSYYLVGLWTKAGTSALTMQLFRQDGGALSGLTDSTFMPEVNKWHRFVIQVDDVDGATKMRARFWLDGTNEPNTWAIDATDGSAQRLTTGRIGIWSAVRGDAYVDDLAAKSPVDHTAPVITFLESGRVLAPGSTNPVGHDAHVEIRATDDLSGVDTVTATRNNEPYKSLDVIAAEGPHLIVATATDRVGNKSTSQVTVLVDKTAPVITVTGDGAALPAIAKFKSVPTIVFSAKDVYTGETVTATLDNQAFLSNTKIEQPGWHTLVVTAVDGVGNKNILRFEVLVDLAAPVITIAEKGVPITDGSKTFTYDPRFDIKVADVHSAPSDPAVAITIDGAAYKSGDLYTVSGWHDLLVVAEDVAGNKSERKLRFLVDKDMPVVRFFEGKAADGKLLDPSKLAAYKGDVAIDIKVSDATSKEKWTALLNGTEYTPLAPITTEQTHTLTVTAEDEAGNKTVVSLSVLVDKGAPTIEFREFPSGKLLDPRVLQKYTQDVAVEIVARDAVSTASFTATIDGAKYESKSLITTQRTHVIEVTATDTAGNTATARIEVLVDKTLPVIRFSESGKPLDTTKRNDFGRDVRVDLDVTDNLPGMTFTAKLDGTDYTSGSPITTDGPHSVEVVATDLAGNKATAKVDLLVDKTGPVIEVTAGERKLVTTERNDFNALPTITIKVTDALTNPTSVITLDGLPFATGSIVGEGTHVLLINAKDDLGNATVAKYDLLVDKTEPVVTLKEGDAPLAPNQIFNRDANIRADIVDISKTRTVATLNDQPFSLSVPIAEEKKGHRLVVTVTDELKWSTTVTATFTVDKTAPVVTIWEGETQLLAGASFARDVRLTAKAVDITAVTFTATLRGPNGGDPRTYNLGDPITVDGEYTITVTGRDEANNVSAPVSIVFYVGKEAPEVTVLESGQPFPAGKTFTRPVVATATVKSATPTTTGATVDGATYELGTPWDVEKKDQVLKVTATNIAGKATTVDVRFSIDHTPPQLELFANGAPFTDDAKFKADVKPTFTASDNQTLKSVVMTLDGQTLAEGSTISDEKFHVISAVATDDGGLTRTAGPFRFVIDKSRPAVKVMVDGKQLVTGDKFNKAVTPKVVVEDLTKTTITATLNGSTWTPDTEISADGVHTLVVKVVDDLGNETILDPIELTIDKTPPVVSVYESEQLFTGGRFKRNLTPVVRIQDLTKTTTTATLDGNPWASGQEISSEGHHTLKVLVTDELAWSAVIPDINFTIDKTAPGVTIIDEETGLPLVTDSIFNRDLKPGIRIVDTTKTTVTATLDGQPFTFGTVITAEGSHTLAVKVVDELDLETIVPPITFVIDKTKPVLVLTEGGQPLVDNALLNHNAVPHLTITDLTAVTVTAKLDGASYVLDTPVTAEGPHTLEISAKDAAGWVTVHPTVRFFIDKTAPAVAVTESGQPFLSGSEFSRNVKPKITVTDISATTIDAKLDGAPFASESEVSAEGEHLLTVTVTDAANWKTTLQPIAFIVDKSPPDVTVTESNQPFVSGMKFNRDVLPVVTIKDLTRTTTVATLDGQPYTIGTAVTTDGVHKLDIKVTDNLGHPYTVPTITFTVDKTAPVVSITESGQPLTTGKAFRRAVKPQIQIQDLTQTAVAALLNDQPFTFGTEITAEGKYTLAVTVTDELGWKAVVPAIVFYVDLTEPVVSVVENDKPLASGSFFNRDVTPKVVITDTTETTVTATLNAQPYTMGTVISAEGAYTLTVNVTDAVGLSASAGPITFTIDKTPPAITVTSPPAGSSVSTAILSVAGDSDDAVSVVVAGVEATIDSAAKKYVATGIELVEGENVLPILAADRAGNNAQISVSVQLDTRAPEITVTRPAAESCSDATSIEVAGTVRDASLARVTISHGTTSVDATISADKRSFTATVPLPNEGKIVLRIAAVDGAGQSAGASVPVTIDRTRPVIEVTESGAPFTAPLVNRPVALSVRAADADPRATLTVTLDGQPYAPGTPIATEGAHVLRAKATDCAGNQSDERVVNFSIDRTAPRIVSFQPASGAAVGSKPAITGVLSEPASVVLDGSGVAAQVTGVNFTINAPLVEGLNTLGFVVTDLAGNASRSDYALTVDTTAPTVEIVESGRPIAANSVFARAVTPVIRTNDSAATITATLNGQPFTSGTSISSDGSYTITAKARDAQGNESPQATASFRIDRSGPSITITSPANDAVLNAEFVEVRGTIGGTDVTGVVVNGEAATVSGTAFTANVRLELGPNVITATASDGAGNSASASVDVMRSAGTVGLVLTSPPDKMLTNRPTTVVAGQVLTPAATSRVTINGTQVPLDAAGAFSKLDFTLTEGENTITAAHTGGNGPAASATVTVTADFTPPSLTVNANGAELSDGARYAASPALTLVATDNRPEGVTTRFTVDGAVVTPGVLALDDGGHALTAIARDAAGNETRVDRVFFVGTVAGATGCALSNIDPVDGTSLFGQTVRISGRSGGAAGVLINGTAAAVAEGSFCGDATLAIGRNEVTIACVNASGQAAGTPVTLVLHRYDDPTITITSPENGKSVPAGPITVTGTVGAGVTSGDVNGIAFTIPDDGAATHTFSVPNVPLAPGLNVITARARTKSARIAVATARVKLTGVTPRIAITSPLPGSETGATTIDVSGTYGNVVPSTIKITIGTTQFAATATPQSDTTGTFTATVTLPPSTSTVTATGANAASVTATDSITIQRVETLPAIVITEPADNTFLASTATGTLRVSGTITAPGGSQVQVSGVSATVTGGTFSADVTLPASGSASTPIIARVTTPESLSATDAVRVVRLAAPLAAIDTFPAADAAGVEPGALVIVLFNNPLAASTASAAMRVTDAAGATVEGEISVDKDAIAFAPLQPLRFGQRYTVNVGTSLKDVSGASLAAAKVFSFTVGATAASTAPILDEAVTTGCISAATITGRVATPGARVRLDVDGVTSTTTSSGTGAFKFTFTFSGQSGYHTVRVREIGADGTLSPERAVCYRLTCAVPQVIGATLDRNAKTLAIQFSKAMDATSLVAAPGGTIVIVPEGESALTGTVAMSGAGDIATVTLATIPNKNIALTVKKTVKDTGGATMAADYAQTFSIDAGPGFEQGKGHLTGAIYDATTGRPLANATVAIAGTTTVTAERGRYARSLAEGAYTIEASAPNYTSAWRQTIVPAGAGVVPIDIRLTRRGAEQTANGSALTLTHGADTTVTKKAELSLTAASLAGGRKVRLTSVGAQALAGLLPLGWSPIAAAEIAVDGSATPQPIPGAKLTFTVDRSAVTAANQTLSLVQYDATRDEWQVVSAVATVAADGKVVSDILTSGNYALVYPDKAAHLTAPPPARGGAALRGVANPCITTPDVCTHTRRSFNLEPKSVLPTGRTTATLVTEGTKAYPSGTAVQAFIDEQLNLADGRVLVDPPFATDLLIYRSLAGDTGVADFHLAPSAQAAAAVMLRDGVDHIRIVNYPGRIDRGTLIGAAGGRVPGDDRVTIDVPAGATAEPLHASVTSMSATDVASLGTVAGFRVAGGFTFSLTRTGETQPEGEAASTPLLLTPAKATISVPAPVAATAQVVIAEVLSSTPYGLMFRLVALTSPSNTVDTAEAKLFVTRPIVSTQLPLDGIVRDGRYLVLVADAPIAYAYGQVRLGSATGAATPHARVTSGVGSPMTAALGVADVTRLDGVFVAPVAAKPSAPFSLVARSVTTGDGATAVASGSPDPDTFVNFGLLTMAAQPPQLVSVSPANESEVDVASPLVVQATFDMAIDAASIADGIRVSNLTTGKAVPGTVVMNGASTVRFNAGEPLRAASRYSVTVAPAIRSTRGAPFGRAAVSHFTTRAIPPGNTSIRRDLIRITIPDENGKSTISGRPGALPAGAQAVAVRRGRQFIVGYQATVANDGSFSFAAGHGDPQDRITTSDAIDLQVIDAVSRGIIAVIEVTPFVTADGKGFLAPVTDKEIRFTSADNITVVVPGGAFDTPTMVTVTASDKQPLTVVPKFDQELAFIAGTKVEFDGIAKKRLQLELPVPAGFVPPAGDLMLGWLGNSIRGPRLMIVDTLRIDGNRFTTAEVTSASSLKVRSSATLTGPEVKKYLLGVIRSGIYSVVNTIIPIPGAWSILTGLDTPVDFFWNQYESLFASDFYLTEGRGRIAIPVVPGKTFRVEGVDSATGFTVFQKEYPNADQGVIENVNADVTGPYPVFVSPGRVDIVDLDRKTTTIRNFELTRGSDDVSIKALDLPVGTKVQALVPARGTSTPALSVSASPSAPGATAAGVDLGTIDAFDGDRVVLLSGAVDLNAMTEVTVAFNEPLHDAVLNDINDHILLDAYLGTRKIELSEVAEYAVDSNGRRVQIALASGHLIRGATYELTLRSTIKDAAGKFLGQGVMPGANGQPTPNGGNQDLTVAFKIRDALPKFGSGFELEPSSLYKNASLRDMTQYGNLVFVSALDGGILAYDVSDAAALRSAGTTQPKPYAFVPAQWSEFTNPPAPAQPTVIVSTPGLNDHWAVAADHHGRIYSSGFTNIFSAIRSYRVEDFIAAHNSTSMCAAANPPLPNALCTFRGAGILGWKPGYSSSLSTASGALLSDRAEAYPRKIQLLIQDDEQKYEGVAAFKASLVTATVTATVPSGCNQPSSAGVGQCFEKVSAGFKYTIPSTYDPKKPEYYSPQRVTVENVTRNLRWSADVPPNQAGPTMIDGIIAAQNDTIKVYRNLRTYALVSQFGHGIGVFDLNAIETNDSPYRPPANVWKPLREQIIASRANAQECCTPLALSPGDITDLAFASEAAVVPANDPTRLVAFAPDVHKGALGVGIHLGKVVPDAGQVLHVEVDPVTNQPLLAGECVTRDAGLLLGSTPRLAEIKSHFTPSTRPFRPRYQSVSYYRGQLGDRPMDYVLVAGGDLGLVALHVGPEASPYLRNADIAGLIWLPNGVVSVRTIPRSHLATVVDRHGYVYIVDLSKIDERTWGPDPNNPTGPHIVTNQDQLFPTAKKVLSTYPPASTTPPNPTPDGWSPWWTSPNPLGDNDPRVLWVSTEPLVKGTMAPLLDPDTGILIAGDTMAKTMRVVPAIDPQVRMMIHNGTGYVEVDGITPLGIAPRPGFVDAKSDVASSGAFRIEVSLPAAAANAVMASGGALQIALESEVVAGADAAQTPDSLPKAHLRQRDRNDDADPRPTQLKLHPDIPAVFESEIRLQKGATRFVSDWIVAVADPRASEKWNWTGAATAPLSTSTQLEIDAIKVAREAAGCANCLRPKHLRQQTEANGVYELWSGGRYLTVRPDGALVDNMLIGTPYEYLGRNGRLTARFSTIRGRKVRPTEVLVPAHNAPVAEGMLQETHYVHSGEVETAAKDLDAGGRAGINVVIARTYRSRTLGGTELGEGWDSPIYRFLLQLPNGDVEYHDGSGEIWTFELDDVTGTLEAPRGLFLRLSRTPRGWVMIDQQFRIAEFNDLGQLVRESDEFYDPAKPGSGNTIRYVYDVRGRLERIVDPLGRETVLEYHATSGRLIKASAEWRKRSVEYEHDSFGRLLRAKLPEVQGYPGVPSQYSHAGTNGRPVIEYTYKTLNAPPPNALPASPAYTDFAEFHGNLLTIKDPEQVRAGQTGRARVTFDYDYSADSDKRDRNISQQWATGETATFSPHPDGYVDVLGQKRTYALTGAAQFDERRHLSSRTLHNVPVIKLAEGNLDDVLDVAAVNVTPSNQLTVVTTYDYDLQGLRIFEKQPNGLEITHKWVPASGAPGMVLDTTTEQYPGGPSAPLIETKYRFDNVPMGTANVSGVGRSYTKNGPYTFRSSETPSRNRPTVTSGDVGFSSTATFNESGQLWKAATSGGGAGMDAEVTYYPPSTTNPIESGRPHRIRRGGGAIAFESKYSLSGEFETESTTDLIRNVTTTIVKDVEGRVVSRVMSGQGLSTEELYGYNRDGRLAWQSRKQTEIPSGTLPVDPNAPNLPPVANPANTVVTTTRYDALGRITGTATFGGRVLLDPTTPGAADFVPLETKTIYDLSSKEITDYDAHRHGYDATAPRTIKKLDGLGRVVETRREGVAQVPDVPAGSVRAVSFYDIHGQVAYTSDGKRTASLTKHDLFGRPIATLLADGTRAHVSFTEWDEVLETVGFQKKTAVGAPLIETARTRNVYTEQGRLRLSVSKIENAQNGRSRGLGFSWEQADRVTTNRIGEMKFDDPALPDTGKVRVAQTTRDTAGRVVSEIVGEAEGPTALVTAANTYSEMRVTAFSGDLADEIEHHEPRAGRKTKSETKYDGLGRPIETRDGLRGGAYESITTMGYDEAGNVLTLHTPDLPPAVPARMHYDARGLMYRQELPSDVSSPNVIQRVYDERGTLRQYIDEQTPGAVTHYDVDAIGRVWRIRYPGGDSEESRFEDGTGVLLATRDRAGQWICFEYDDDHNGRLVAEHLGGNGPQPSYAAGAITRYAYDDAGRVTRITNADAAIEFADFDLLGRPGITRLIRFKKTGCIPSQTPCGSGLTGSPQISEVYTQGHEWSAFGEERTRWRMPVVGSSLPADNAEVNSAWRNWIEETRDAASNVTRQGEAVSRTATATAVIEAQARGMGRLTERKRVLPGGELLTKFGYADLDDDDQHGPSGAPAATGALTRHEVFSANPTQRIAGTEITQGVDQRIAKIEDLGIAERESTFEYDLRQRLKGSKLLRRENATSDVPEANHEVEPTGFVGARLIDLTRQSLMAKVGGVVPFPWDVDQVNAAGQMKHRQFPGAGQSGQTFDWVGGRRTNDQRWSVTYDARGRLVVAESADRLLAYDYDPDDRLVGRTAMQKSGTTWTLETRTNVLARDGLPAASTFVWDPIVDRIVAVYDATAIANAATPGVETGLVRQILHGDQAYDDPIEVLIAGGSAVKRYLPILDEAGTGSLQAVADADGNLVERVLYADAYGDAPRYLQGAVVERIETEVAGQSRKITVTFSEPLDSTTIAGIALEAVAGESVLRTFAAPGAVGERQVQWTVPASFAEGADNIRITVASTVRFKGWGGRQLQAAAPWEALLGRATAMAQFPFIKTMQVEDFNTTGTPYDLPDLYLAGRSESISQLLFDFHGLPLRDPATQLVYVRARWYDASTASFLTPDPMGYADASNLYAYAGSDPVNAMDPSGQLSWGDVGSFLKGAGKGAVSGADGLLSGLADTIIGVGKASYYATGALLYKTTGGEQYREQSETFHQALDTFNKIVENPHVIKDAVVSKYNEVKATIKSGDAEAIGQLAGGAAFEVASELVPALAVSKLGKLGKVVRAAEMVDDVAGAGRAADTADSLADISSVTRRAAPALRHADEVADATRAMPQKINCVGACVAAATPIALASGTKAIEELRIGDRVAPTDVNPDLPDGWTEVNPVNWHVVKLTMPDAVNGGRYDIEMLRPVEWIVANEAYPGRTIELLTARNELAAARVVSIAASPRIASGPGRVVLSTFTHHDQIVRLVFEGAAGPLDTTSSHLLYSADRGDWVPTATLQAGDRLRTSTGEAKIASVEHRNQARVFDIEVEGDHSYFAGGGAGVLSHNCDVGDEVIGRLRQSTPNDILRHLVNKGGRTTVKDPAIGLFDSKFEADHVVPFKEIINMPGFSKLTYEQMLDVLNYPRNFVGLIKSANASKGAQDWFTWKLYKKGGIAVNASFARKMQRKTLKVRYQLQQQINAFLSNQ